MRLLLRMAEWGRVVVVRKGRKCGLDWIGLGLVRAGGMTSSRNEMVVTETFFWM